MLCTKIKTALPATTRLLTFFSISILAITFLMTPRNATCASPLLQWDKNPDASYYIVYWRTEKELSYSHFSTQIPSGTTSFQLMPASDGTVYCYSIKAFNACGSSSDFSDEIKTPNMPYDSNPDSSITPSSAKITLDIILPTDGTIGNEGVLTEFAAKVFKNNQLTSVCDITWTSSIDGIIGQGMDIKAVLSPGIHVIIATTKDEFGNIGSDTMTFMVAAKNNPPQITNLTGTAGVTTTAGQAYQLSGTAIDKEDGDISKKIEWTSSIIGKLGTGALIQTTLTPGVHTITATVTDSKGSSVSSSIKLTAETYNAPPVVTIQKILPGSSLPAGQTHELLGNATDLEDGDISSKIVWISNINGSLGTGAYITPILSAGTHTITARVTDIKGKISEITQTVTVQPYNYPPSVTITGAVKGSFVSGAQTYEFTATATDKEDGDLGSTIKWSSSKDGNLGSGSRIYANLTTGLHTVTATATDSKGKTGTATVQISVEVVNTLPVVSITSSSPGVLGPNGQVYTFTGSASDAEDGNLTSSIIWTSSKDGCLGTGSVITPTLSSGSHTITASVKDSFGKNTATSLQIIVAVYNVPPTIAIISASPGVLSASGQTYSLTGTAYDKEDGSLGASIVWTSSKDGKLGTGASILATLSPGSHIITAQVSDSLGKSASATVAAKVDVYNNPPSITIASAIPGIQTEKGQPYNFTGKVIDTEDGDLSWSIVWISSKDGNIGTGSSIQPVLSCGSHTITATACDSKGKSSTTSIQVTVLPYNYPPSTAITVASPGTVNSAGQVFGFTGRATDTEDGDISANIVWTSSKSGALGKGANVLVTLPAGQQTVTATVTDSKGKSSADSRVISAESYNNPPSVKISSITAGAQNSTGQTYTLTGTASDAEDGNISGSIAWSSSINGSLGTGSMVTRSLSTGTHTITATIMDSKGKSSRVSMPVTVMPFNNPPVLTAISSLKGGSTLSGQIYTFSAGASDAEDGDLSPSIIWSIDTRGIIGKGTSVQTVLPSGNYVITASVTDSKGKKTNAAKPLSISWTNKAPVVDSLKVVPGSSGKNGQMFTVTGKAMDEEDGNINSSMIWSSSIDGIIGTGPTVTAMLSAGSHTITAKATDSLGKSAVSSLSFSSSASNSPPRVEILKAIEGTQTSTGQTFEFAGKAMDDEDGILSANIVWSSNKDGVLGKGSQIRTALSDGPHIITARIMDSKGLENRRSMDIVSKRLSLINIQVSAIRFFSMKIVSVSWSGATSKVKIYKNNKPIGSGEPNGSRYYWYTGPAQYKVVDSLSGKSSLAKSVR